MDAARETDTAVYKTAFVDLCGKICGLMCLNF
jgi:hypothetical protein